MNKLLYIFLALFLLAGCALTSHRSPDEIVVVKSERKMYLIDNGAIFKIYDIGLGQEPEGHKQKRGDMKTPEGTYYIDGHNPNSRFYLSLSINYPDAEDKYHAKKRGHDPGDDIVIHGMRGRGSRAQFLENGDWTEGCIAVTNDDMYELFHAIEVGTPITIYP